MPPTLDELTVADPPSAWSALGFAVEGETCVVGGVRIRLAGADAGRGLVGWSLRGVEAGDLDGLATLRSDREPPGEAPSHPNGIAAVDHVVAISPDLDRSVAVLEGAGLDLRRIREEPTPAGAPRQAFFRLGSTILEVVQEPAEAAERVGGGERPAFFWGLALVAPDLDATVAELGRARRRGARRGPARPSHRHPAPRRRSLGADRADDPTRAGLAGRHLIARLIYSTIASLDGYVADADGNFDWAAPDEEVHAFVNELERPVGTYLYGRRMYETMKVWETMDAEPDLGPAMRDFTAIWRAAEKVVYSRTLEAVSSARTRIEREFDPEAVRRLKAAAARDITVGGPELAGRALAAGLVDELQVFLAPVVVGGGNPRLPADLRLDLELLEERRFANGTAFLRYATT